jgi:hypothetical protein
MIKISIIEDSSDGKVTHQGKIALETSERVHDIEVAAMLTTITSDPFQRQVKSILREICKKHHILVSEIPGL